MVIKITLKLKTPKSNVVSTCESHHLDLLEPTPVTPIVEPTHVVPIVEPTPVVPIVEPTPSVFISETPHVLPIVEPNPSVVVSETTPILPIIEPTPAIVTTEPTPVIVTNEPTPITSNLEPTPVTTEPTPVTVNLEPTSISVNIEPTPIVTVSEKVPPMGGSGHGGTSVLPPPSNLEKIHKYQQLPKYKQKSQQWLDQRNDYLTASTIAAAIGIVGTAAKNNLLIGKVSNGKISSFNGNTATHWGNKYEPVANGVYSYRNQIKIYDFGMVTNPKYPILGVSPDGITESRMLEIKCPWSRVIDGKIKTEYYHQMQEQMAVCEFDQCDFLECRFIETNDTCFWDDFDYYDPKENINREKGIIIQYINLKEIEIDYLYSPIEYYNDSNQMKEWHQHNISQMLHSDDQIYLGETYWYLAKYNCQLVESDPTWITTYYPILQQFWDQVIYYRKMGIEHLLEHLRKKTEIIEKEETSKITDFYGHKSSSSPLIAINGRKKKPHCML